MSPDEVVDLKRLLLSIELDLMDACTASGLEGVKPAFMYAAAAIAAGETRVGSIAEYVGITQQAVGKTLHQMNAAGFVRYVQEPQDHRALSYSLTEEGERFRVVAESVCQCWGYDE